MLLDTGIAISTGVVLVSQPPLVSQAFAEAQSLSARVVSRHSHWCESACGKQVLSVTKYAGPSREILSKPFVARSAARCSPLHTPSRACYPHETFWCTAATAWLLHCRLLFRAAPVLATGSGRAQRARLKGPAARLRREPWSRAILRALQRV